MPGSRRGIAVRRRRVDGSWARGGGGAGGARDARDLVAGVEQEAETETFRAHRESMAKLLPLLVEVALRGVAVGVRRSCPGTGALLTSG